MNKIKVTYKAHHVDKRGYIEFLRTRTAMITRPVKGHVG